VLLIKLLNFNKSFILAICLICYGCDGNAVAKNEIEKVIQNSLSSGTDNNEIINFLERENWIYDFDRHSNRYQARNPEEDKLPEVWGRNQIYIYVNEDKEFVHTEVVTVYNGL